jgi:hypothetical protein
MVVLGIDPGKNGAVVLIESDLSVCTSQMPLVANEFDTKSFADFLRSRRGKIDHIFIEDVHAIFNSAAGATFTFGFICGIIQGVVCASQIPYTLVQPKKWQSVVYQGVPEIRKPDIIVSKGKHAGEKRRGPLDTKAMSEIAAKRLFPSVDLRASERCKKCHDGIVDALLIAEYGRRTMISS